jgi:hypothetical protein
MRQFPKSLFLGGYEHVEVEKQTRQKPPYGAFDFRDACGRHTDDLGGKYSYK